jgi:antibiotic biosynthesis monooxygenase (ABM) superfamily enzyme
MISNSMSQPVHVAIIRRVRPGREAEFEQALREFIETSFSHGGVLGAHMLVPLPGSGSREFGILRTFKNERERDEFYNSPLFKKWVERAKMLTEGEPLYRPLHGLETWFRGSRQPEPPQWKMALLTFIAVWPVSMAVPAVLNPLLGRSVPNVVFAGAVAAGIVLVLTWIAMPVLVKVARHWLQPKPQPSKGHNESIQAS